MANQDNDRHFLAFPDGVATVPAGTLWDGTYDSKSSISSTELDYASTVSTNSTVHASTTHGTCFSNLNVSSNTT